MIVAAITEVEADSPRAHFINVVKTAGGFARLGHRVILLCRAAEHRAADVATTYGEPALEVVTAPMPHGGCSTAADSAATFARWAADECSRRGVGLAYARSFPAALACADLPLPTVLETHAYVNDPNPLLTRCLGATAKRERPIAGLVTISPRLAEHYIARGADPRRVRIVPDGVDVELFTPPASPADWGPDPLRAWTQRSEARDQGPEVGSQHRRLQHPSSFPAHAPTHANVLYSGHLYDYKGIPTLIDAAARLDGVTVHLLGGTPEDAARARERAAHVAPGRVVVHGRVPHADVPRYLWHADALLLPPSAREPSASWTSPVKLGEYLAAGPPIVASDIPGLRDWVTEPAVRWFRPDDPRDMAHKIREAVAEAPAQREARRRASAALARRYSYAERAAAVLAAAGLG